MCGEKCHCDHLMILVNGITPRVCGEKTKGTLYFGDHYGSPPRMRGKELCML